MNDQVNRPLLRNLLGDQLCRFARSKMNDFITGVGRTIQSSKSASGTT
jgi:hypothetical protein